MTTDRTVPCETEAFDALEIALYGKVGNTWEAGRAKRVERVLSDLAAKVRAEQAQKDLMDHPSLEELHAAHDKRHPSPPSRLEDAQQDVAILKIALAEEGGFLRAAERKVAEQAQEIARLTADVQALATAISQKHGATWGIGALATLARAHRQDSEAVDDTRNAPRERESLDWDFDRARVELQERIEKAEADLAAQSQAIEALVAEMREKRSTHRESARICARHLDNEAANYEVGKAAGIKHCADRLAALVPPRAPQEP